MKEIPMTYQYIIGNLCKYISLEFQNIEIYVDYNLFDFHVSS